MAADSKRPLPEALFVTGTDTAVGKTLVSAILMRAWRGTYWKPIQSGIELFEDQRAGVESSTDTEWVRKVTGLGPESFLPERVKTKTPLSPHLSAAIDGIEIALDDFTLPPVEKSPLIAEGAGGLMVPINDHSYLIDLISHLKLPVLLVSRSTLGTINHTLLSIAALRARDIELLGVVVNGPENKENEKAIAEYGATKILGALPPLDRIDQTTLDQVYERLFDDKMSEEFQLAEAGAFGRAIAGRERV